MQGSEAHTGPSTLAQTMHVVNGLAVTEEQRQWHADRLVTFAANHAGRLYNAPFAIIHPCLFSPTPVPREPPHQCCLVLVNPWKLLVLSQPVQHIHHCLKESVAFSRPWYVFSLRGKQLKYKSYISNKPRLTEDLSH